MSDAPQMPHRKVKPQQSAAVPTGLIIGGVLVGVLLIVLALALAAREDREEAERVTPTFVPAPTFPNGETLRDITFVYTAEEIPFSVIAAPNNENPEQRSAACQPMRVFRNPQDGNYFYLDPETETYWVYARRTDDTGWNGWLPFEALSLKLPESCQAAATPTP